MTKFRVLCFVIFCEMISTSFTNISLAGKIYTEEEKQYMSKSLEVMKYIWISDNPEEATSRILEVLANEKYKAYFLKLNNDPYSVGGFNGALEVGLASLKTGDCKKLCEGRGESLQPCDGEQLSKENSSSCQLITSHLPKEVGQALVQFDHDNRKRQWRECLRVNMWSTFLSVLNSH